MTAASTIAAPAKHQQILSLWFPHLPTDRILRLRFGRYWRSDPAVAARRAEQPPLAVSHHDRNTRRIAALCEQAEALGLRRGLGLADARAMHPALDVVEADPDADRQLIGGLADWCDRYTPLVALDGEDGLLLDITGCVNLFGGEKSLLADLLSRLFHQGFDVRAALAATPGMAWAAARFCRESAPRIVAPGQEARALFALPLAALRLEHDTVTRLESVGLRTVGAIMTTARAPLARRFGKKLLTRLDQTLGRLSEPISPRLPVAELSVERRLAEPVLLAEDIERLTTVLCTTLKAQLEQREEGARALELALFRLDGAVNRIAIGTSRPVREPELIRRLFSERLAAVGDSLDAGYGYELVRLSVLASAPFDARQADLAGDDRNGRESLSRLIDRIHARLGNAAVLKPVSVDSHIPERAVRHEPFGEEEPPAPVDESAESAPTFVPSRPLRLFRCPEPVEAMAEVPEGPPVMFRWRRALHRVTAAEGPERLAPEWWRADDGHTRDYYRIEDQAGRRYWLYRQGFYSGASDGPRWFMHGIFA